MAKFPLIDHISGTAVELHHELCMFLDAPANQPGDERVAIMPVFVPVVECTRILTEDDFPRTEHVLLRDERGTLSIECRDEWYDLVLRVPLGERLIVLAAEVVVLV